MSLWSKHGSIVFKQWPKTVINHQPSPFMSSEGCVSLVCTLGRQQEGCCRCCLITIGDFSAPGVSLDNRGSPYLMLLKTALQAAARSLSGEREAGDNALVWRCFMGRASFYILQWVGDLWRFFLHCEHIKTSLECYFINCLQRGR